jgi:glycosyltransferase involved in cell wall biosynthesis
MWETEHTNLGSASIHFPGTNSNDVETKRSQSKGYVAIFFWEGYLSVAPSLINAIRLLANEGYHVDVITRPAMYGDYAAIPSFPDGVRIFMDGLGSELPSRVGLISLRDECGRVRVRKYMPKVVRDWLRRAYARIEAWRELVHFARFSARSVRGQKYTCFIGIDMLGLVTAFAVRLLKQIPIIYWSLEIRFLNDFTHGMARVVKRLERICHRRAAFLIIQDWERADSLISENRIRHPKTVIVPNSPLGWPECKKNDFFQKKFDIATNRRIIVSMGMISPSVLSLEIASEASKWKDDSVLVFHERAKRSESDPYIDQVRQAGRGKVFLSLDPVPYEKLDDLVLSAHIGLVFYRRELGANFSQIAGASGKLAHYLRCGLPVICLDLPGLVKVVDRYRCGICVSEPGEIQSAIETILREYPLYRMNALKCYEESYEFGRYFREVLRKIDEFGPSKGYSL